MLTTAGVISSSTSGNERSTCPPDATSCAAAGCTAPPENDNVRHVTRMAAICGARGRPMNIVDLPIWFLRVGCGDAVAPEEIFRRRSFARLVRLETNPARRRGSWIIVAGRLARGPPPAPPHG